MGKTAASESGSKHPHEGALLDSGLSERSAINQDPGVSGMDTKGPDQKPMATPRQKVTGKGKDFEIR